MKLSNLLMAKDSSGVMGLVSVIADVASKGCDTVRDGRAAFKETTVGLDEVAPNLGRSAAEIAKSLTARSNGCVRIANAIYHFKSGLKDIYLQTKDYDNTAAEAFNRILGSFQCMEYVSLLTEVAEVPENPAKSGGAFSMSTITGSANGVGSRLGTAGTDGELKTIDGVFYTATGKNGGQSAELNPATQQYIYNMCQETGMDYPLAFAMWYCENTAYESHSKSSGGTMGLTYYYRDHPDVYSTFRANKGENVDKLIENTWKKTYGEGASWSRDSFGEGTIYYDMAVAQAMLLSEFSYKDNMYEAMRTYCGGNPSTRFKIANELRAQMGWEQVDYETVLSNTATQNGFYG